MNRCIFMKSAGALSIISANGTALTQKETEIEKESAITNASALEAINIITGDGKNVRIIYIVLFLVFMFYSCKNEEYGDLMEITFDIGKNNTITLSEITEEITSIKLELTDESMINSDMVSKVLLCDSIVFIAEPGQLLIFDIKGKFIRSIGSKGQGPGEFIFLKDFTFDEKNKIIYIIDQGLQIISYDFNGNFLKKTNFY